MVFEKSHFRPELWPFENCPKSTFLTRVVRLQSIETKWHFRALFCEIASLFWFSPFTVFASTVKISFKLKYQPETLTG